MWEETNTLDHWCRVPGFSKTYFQSHPDDISANWTWEKALESGIAFPLVRNQQRRGKIWHDQCSYYKLSPPEYKKYLRMDPTSAIQLVDQRNQSMMTTKRCTSWDYDESVCLNMRILITYCLGHERQHCNRVESCL